MSRTQKHKANKKKSKKIESDNGELNHVVKQSKRFPIVSLPDITSSPVRESYRRYITTSAGATSLSIYNLHNQFLFAVSAILAYPTHTAVRIKKIRLLAPVTTQGTSVTLKAQPVTIDTSDNCFNTVPETYTDTSTSIDIPAYLSLTPSMDTPLGSWHYTVNIDKDLVLLTYPAGTTMDILLEYVENLNSFYAPTYSNVLAGATAGQIYCRKVAVNFTPVSIANAI